MKYPALVTSPLESVIIIRLMVGVVFIIEGLQKIFLPETWGTARFEELGFYAPAFFSYCVGILEIICSICLLLGFLTRFACMPLLVVVTAGFAATKADIFVDEGAWGLLHSSRTDYAMLMGNIFLFISGGGKWSVDIRYSADRSRSGGL